MQLLTVKCLALFAMATVGHAVLLRGQGGDSTFESTEQGHRSLAPAYYSTSDPNLLGSLNPDAAIGNPLKGLVASPSWTGGVTKYTIPNSLEFTYMGMTSVMKGDSQFDWTTMDKTLTDAASRNNHVIWRIYVDYPGSPLAMPQYLIDAGVKLVPRNDGGVSPQYDDVKLLRAFEQLIAAMGARYDGHKSIGFIQLGLLGKWGEWHTYPEEGLMSAATMDKVIGWYKAAFKTTKLQTRGASQASIAAGMGLHDDSFAYSTLGNVGWFFWPRLVSGGYTDFWKKGPMGGETRPELQGEVFDPSYVPAPDYAYKQDFMQCVETTHATYMFTHGAFMSNSYVGAELENAKKAHARMGYNFHLSNVAISASTAGTVIVNVTIKQVGVAPFYYPLSLALNCSGTRATLSGVETLIEAGSTKVFSFASIPADKTCLENVRFSLESPFAYAGKPIKFAQGDGTVVVNLPLLNGSTPIVKAPAPVSSTVSAPANAPIEAPTTAPLQGAIESALRPSILIDGNLNDSPRFVISGSTSVFRSRMAKLIGAKGFKARNFRSQRWSREPFMYTIAGFEPNMKHTVTLGFAEMYLPNCATGKRVFNILANDEEVASNFDVFSKAGCRQGYISIHVVTADALGEIDIKFVPVRENPFVSFIHIVQN
jgi:Malectin domain